MDDPSVERTKQHKLIDIITIALRVTLEDSLPLTLEDSLPLR
jgi:hypothetical protein